MLDDVVRYGGACTREKICIHIVISTEISERASQKTDGAMANINQSKERHRQQYLYDVLANLSPGFMSVVITLEPPCFQHKVGK